MSASHRYTVHGLEIASELELPELRPSIDPAAAPDVVVRCASVPRHADSRQRDWFQVREDGTAFVRIEGVARFALRNGSDVDVEALQGSDLAAVRAYLVGPVMRLLLHQRDELPLHVSAVVIDGLAWAFTGPAGTGKSTVAAALHLHAGMGFLTDDVGIVRPSPSSGPGGWMWPGPSFLKLRSDAFSGVCGLARDFLPDFVGSDKIRVLAGNGMEPAPVRLAGLLILERSAATHGPALLPRRLEGAEAFLAAHAMVHDQREANSLGCRATRFARVAWLANELAIFHSPIPLAATPASSERALRLVEALRMLDHHVR
jgi:hypothetical protein